MDTGELVSLLCFSACCLSLFGVFMAFSAVQWAWRRGKRHSKGLLQPEYAGVLEEFLNF
ncbi:MAG: hypothetical protein HC915_18410 [Anaerolineae bacterium]|nr:hypothetical protein [Anaerolineae bacterium]